MFLDQLAFIHIAQLSFFDDELAANNGVIGVDRLTKDNRRDRIMHTGKTNPIEIDGEEISALSNFQATDVVSSQNGCSTTRA